MRALIILPMLLFAGCTSILETHEEVSNEVENILPQSEGERHSGYTYIPLDPLAVVHRGCETDGEEYARILDQLPDNAVRIATKRLNAGTESSFGPVGVGFSGEEYKIILDYVNVDNTNIPFFIEISEREVWNSETVRFKPVRSYVVRRLTKDRNYIFEDESAAVQRSSGERQEPEEGVVEPASIPSSGYDSNENENDASIVLSGNFVVPVYVGVGLRLTSEIRILKGSVNLSSLPGIAASVEAGDAAGSLVVQTLGVTGKQISTGLTFTSDLNETTVQNAILSLGKIKAILYSNDSVVRPRVTGMYLPFRDGSDELVNMIVSEVARRPVNWVHGAC